MKASELKVGQGFKLPGQRIYRFISEIHEINASDKARPEHIGKIWICFDDNRQTLLLKDDEVIVKKEETIDNEDDFSEKPSFLNKELSRWEFEAYLNSFYSKSMDKESALQHFIYLTMTNLSLQKTISQDKLQRAIRTKRCGWLLRKYDHLRFTSEYENARTNLM